MRDDEGADGAVGADADVDADVAEDAEESAAGAAEALEAACAPSLSLGATSPAAGAASPELHRRAATVEGPAAPKLSKVNERVAMRRARSERVNVADMIMYVSTAGVVSIERKGELVADI